MADIDDAKVVFEEGEIERDQQGNLVWTIDHFSSLNHGVGECVMSPQFTLLGNTWHVDLYPRGFNTECKGCVSVYVQNCSRQPLTARWNLHIVDQRGDELFVSGSPRVYTFLPNRECRYDDLVRRDALLRETHTLRLKIVLERAEQFRPNNVSDSYGKLLESGELSDVTLVVDGTEIAAHRFVLSARSPYFKAMFSHKMSESLEGVVHIDDVALPVFRQLLRFVYTGCCDLEAKVEQKDSKEGKANEEKSGTSEQKHPADKDEDGEQEQTQPDRDMVVHMVALSDRYQIPELTAFCSDQLSNCVAVENAAELLMLAERLHLKDLKKRVLEFCGSRSNMAQVMDTEGFQQLSLAQVHELTAAAMAPTLPMGKKRIHKSNREDLVKADVRIWSIAPSWKAAGWRPAG